MQHRAPREAEEAQKEEEEETHGWVGERGLRCRLAFVPSGHSEGMTAIDSDLHAKIYARSLQPDITFFGEKLHDDFDERLLEDREKVDLLLVIGTSLKVAPVSEILSE